MWPELKCGLKLKCGRKLERLSLRVQLNLGLKFGRLNEIFVDQATRLIHRFEDIAAISHLPQTRKIFEDVAAKINPNISAISAAGFFYITKEYIVGVRRTLHVLEQFLPLDTISSSQYLCVAGFWGILHVYRTHLSGSGQQNK